MKKFLVGVIGLIRAAQSSRRILMILVASVGLAALSLADVSTMIDSDVAEQLAPADRPQPSAVTVEDEVEWIDLWLSGTIDSLEIVSLGGTAKPISPGLILAHLPVDSLGSLVQSPNLERVQIAQTVEFQSNVSVPEVGAPAIWGGSPPNYPPGGFTGEDVVVGIVDTGLDPTHQDFRTAAGTRVVWLWDQNSGQSRPPPSGYSYGSEYSKAAIDSGVYSCGTCGDANGHGTHIAGVAAGNGRGTGNGKPAYTYVGVAPEADLVVVDLRYTLGTDVTDDKVIQGVQYVFEKAAALGKPAVVLLAVGKVTGPHDGSDPLDQGISALTGPGKIVCVAAGNYGGFGRHAEWTSTGSGQTGDITMLVSPYTPSNVAFDIIRSQAWYDAAANYSVSIVTPAGTVVGPIARGDSTTVQTSNGIVSITNGRFASSNGAFLVDLFIYRGNLAYPQVATGTWTFRFTSQAAGTQRVDAWLTQLSIESATKPKFVQGMTEQRMVTSPATANNVIAVGAYATKRYWTDLNGVTRGFVDANEGDIWISSSTGPRRDDIPLPHVASPGLAVAAAKSNQYFPSTQFLMPDSVHGIRFVGTSVAAAHAAGGVALLLQESPTLTPFAASQTLKLNARADAYTGAVPNVLWGWGKLALNLLSATPAAASTWYVRPSGNDAADGTSYANAVATIGRAVTRATNATTAEDHLILAYPNGTGGSGGELVGQGQWSEFPNPIGMEQPYRIRLVSALWLATGDDSTLKINPSNDDLTKSRVTIAGFQFTNGIDVTGGAVGDSIISCSTPLGSGLGVSIEMNGCDSSVVFNCLIRSSTIWMASDNNYDVANTWDSNFWPFLGRNWLSAQNLFTIGQNNGDCVNMRFYRNRLNMVINWQGDGYGSMPSKWFHTRGLLSKYNRWDLWNHNTFGNNEHRAVLYLRDSTYANDFVADTFIVHTDAYQMLEMTSSGAQDYSFDNDMDSCYVYVPGGDGVVYQAGAVGCDVTNSVIAVGERAIYVPGLYNGAPTPSVKTAHFRHNTLVGSSRGDGVNYRGVVNMPKEAQFPAWQDTVVFMDNIVYAYNAPVSCPETEVGGTGYALFVGGQAIDSLAYFGGSDSVTRTVPRITNRKHVFNNNLYFYPADSLPCIGCAGGGSECGGGRSIGTDKSSAIVMSRPGSGYHGNWHSRYGQDSLSFYGSPHLGYDGPDSILAAFENPRGAAASIGRTSEARDRDAGGTDIGAHQYASRGRAQLDKSRLDFTYHGEIEFSGQIHILTIYNIGTGDLEITSVSEDAPQITVSPTSGTIGAGGSQAFTVTWGPVLQYGSYTLTILTDDPTKPTILIPIYVSFDDGES